MTNYNEALSDYNQAIKLFPSDLSAFRCRVNLLDKMGDTTNCATDKEILNQLETLNWQNKYISLAPGYNSLYHHRALTKERLGDAVGAAIDRQNAQLFRNEPTDSEFARLNWGLGQ